MVLNKIFGKDDLRGSTVTISILGRYDEIENQKLTNDESIKFMKQAQKMMAKIPRMMGKSRKEPPPINAAFIFLSFFDFTA